MTSQPVVRSGGSGSPGTSAATAVSSGASSALLQPLGLLSRSREVDPALLLVLFLGRSRPDSDQAVAGRLKNSTRQVCGLRQNAQMTKAFRSRSATPAPAISRPLTERHLRLETLGQAVRDAAGKGWDAAESVISMLAEIDATGDAETGRAALGLVASHPRLVIRLDELARRVLWHSTYYSPVISEIAERLNASTGGPIAVALASTHGNGRVRERAVAHMLEQPTSELMPFLVLRTSDWVRQVRDRARAGLAVLLHDNPAAYLPTAVGMALLAQSRQRGSFARTQVLAGALETPPNMIKMLMTSPDRAVRRFAFDTGMAAHWFRIDDLTVIAETDADLRLRAQAAEAVVREAVWTSRVQILRRLADSRLAEVRVVAVTGLVRAGYPADAAEFLDDSGGLVRAVARSAAGRVKIDALAHYRAAVAADTPSLGAIDGLAEIGSAADGTHLLRLLEHPVAKVRANALRGLRRLDAAPTQWVLPLLRDRSPAVIREATTILRPSAAKLSADMLWSMMADRDRSAIRRAGYRLLQGCDTVIQLRAALILAVDPDPRLAARGIADATRIARGLHHPLRYRRTIPPLTVTPDQINDLRTLTEQAATALSEDTTRRLQTHLDTATAAMNDTSAS